MRSLGQTPPASSESTRERVQINELWQMVLDAVRQHVTRTQFDHYLAHTRLLSVENDVATVVSENAFGAATAQKRFARDVEIALANNAGRPMRVEFIVRGEHDAPGAATPPRPTESSRPAPRPVRQVMHGLNDIQLPLSPSSHGLSPRLTFDTYVVGSSNRLAHAAAVAIAEHPGVQYNPFFVHGGVGLGKTHLLHAIGHRALELNPSLTMLYVTSETFTNEVVNAIRAGRMEDFRDRYRTIDILMVDDIQFIAGKESTQEEFFHTFNALYQAGKQVIVSSDKPPRAIAALEERMRSRFAGGLIADVQSPDFEMRTAILRSKAEELGVQLPADVVEYIARRDQTNIRELEGALNRMLMVARVNNRPISLQIAMESLADSSQRRHRRSTEDDVITAVCDHFDVSEHDLRGKQRSRAIAFPRQIAMFLLREQTDCSLEDIGRALGNRDHTTVLHGIRRVESELAADSRLRADMMTVRERLLNA